MSPLGGFHGDSYNKKIILDLFLCQSHLLKTALIHTVNSALTQGLNIALKSVIQCRPDNQLLRFDNKMQFDPPNK